MKINTLIIKQFLKTRSLRRTKTDKTNALNITEYLMSVPYKTNSSLLYYTYSLKSLCRNRKQIIKERIRFAKLKELAKNKVGYHDTNLFLLMFPYITLP